MTPEENHHQNNQETPHEKGQKSVFRYISILFGAAFLLLLLTFMMERRNSEAALDSLSTSHATTQQNMQQIAAERDALTQEIADLTDQLAQLEADKAQLETHPGRRR